MCVLLNSYLSNSTQNSNIALNATSSTNVFLILSHLRASPIKLPIEFDFIIGHFSALFCTLVSWVIKYPPADYNSQSQGLGVGSVWFFHSTLHGSAHIMSDQYLFPEYITLTCIQKVWYKNFKIKDERENGKMGGKRNWKWFWFTLPASVGQLSQEQSQDINLVFYEMLPASCWNVIQPTYTESLLFTKSCSRHPRFNDQKWFLSSGG